VAVIAMFVVTLSGDELYGGLEAHRVLLKDGAIVLDTRNWRKDCVGRVITDVIDLGGKEVLGTPVSIGALRITVDAEAKSPAAVTMRYRAGSTYFQAPRTWSDWIDVGDHRLPARARYIQVQVVLTTSDPAVVPTVRAVRIECGRQPAGEFAGTVKVVESAIEQIVRSPVAFGYERQDQADLAWMRKTFKLDGVIAGKKTEMDKLAALCTWVASRKNNRRENWHPKTRHYPWDIRVLLREEDGGTVYGHCASYCAVFVTAVNSFGWQARHIANQGYKRRSHEVPEVWVSELRKWVYFDPSLDAYYVDARTGTPLGILEMHDIFLKHMYPGGLVLGSLDEDQQREKNKAINWSTFPARYVSGLWWYGERKQEADFWHWGQGIMTCGYLQMTPRNNFHAQPKPYFTRFGHGPGSVSDFPYWVDAQTPLRSRRLRNWHTRTRDWNWTLNQASMRLGRTADDAVTVELGTSQPFFKRFLATVDGAKPVTIASPYTWRLTPGRNALAVNCEDEFGRLGLPSTVVVEYGT